MTKIAIFLHPAHHKSVESGEDFLVPENEALRRLTTEPTLVPVRQLDGLLDKAAGAAVAREEDAHMVLLIRRG